MRETEIVVLRLLQDEFPLCPRPFLELACRANRGFCRPRTVYFEVIGPGPRRRPVVARHKVKPVSEKEVIAAMASLVRRGQVRRVAAVLGSVEASADGSTRRVLQELQTGLPLVAEPYREVAKRLGMTEDELLSKIQALRQGGGLRRLTAILGPPALQRQRN
ncbi:MAG: Lrp/AsnC family transcriptional regulator [Bacillota bacterium]|nr:MAG: Lrp/AsnC family transcriptional regulator [Bacillota bacterium]